MRTTPQCIRLLKDERRGSTARCLSKEATSTMCETPPNVMPNVNHQQLLDDALACGLDEKYQFFLLQSAPGGFADLSTYLVKVFHPALLH